MSNMVQLAGFGGGIKVFANLNVAGAWGELKSAQIKGNYWASIVVNQIKQLAAGKLNNNFAYVKNLNGQNGVRQFFLILPGCKVLAEARSDGSYVVCDLDVDESYFDKDRHQTGLYFSKKMMKKEWLHEYSKGRLDVSIHTKNLGIATPVGVSDSYPMIDLAAKYTEEHIANSPHNPAGNADVTKSGFNLFYTKSKSTLGGLLNLRQALGAIQHESLHEPALFLSEAMQKAANMPVVWVTQRGGSAVLAQAMGILHAKGVKLPLHSIYLSNPTSSQTDVFRLCNGLDIKVGDQFVANNMLSIDELIGGMAIGSGSLSLIHERQKADKSYGWKKASKDLLTVNDNLQSAAKTITSLGGLAAIGGLFGPGYTMAGILASATSSGAGVVGAAAIGVAAVAVANIPSLKDYNNPRKVLLKKIGF